MNKFLGQLKAKGVALNMFTSFSGSQELHVAAPISSNPAFNKFNSLDRRALNKRQNINGGSNGLLKLASNPPSSTSTSGPESLPVRPLINQFNKEPERRHSSYDPTIKRHQKGQNLISSAAAININGLPDPFSNRIYSSQESLHRGGGSGTPLRPGSSTGSNRGGGAGTPQFQNLSGTIRTTANGLIPPAAGSSAAANSASNAGSNRLTSLYHNGSSSGGAAAAASCSSTTNQQDMNQTPSPSDSAVGDLETMLKEKDTEINYLRETMEQNEQVIFKVNIDNCTCDFH